jgi:hypothetical protein
VTLADGFLTDTWNTPISQANDPIDANRPSQPSTPDLASGSDRGASNSDDITNDDTATFEGIAGSVEGNAIVTVTSSVDGGRGTTVAGSDGSWSHTVPSLSDGTHLITITATDAAGNESVPSDSLSVLIDTQDPETPDNRSPTDNARTNNTAPTFSWTEPSDPGGSGIRDYRIQIDGPPNRDYYTSNLTYTPSLAAGTFTWRIYARDVAGNSALWSADWNFVIDTDPPTVTSVVVDTDPMYEGDLVQQVTVTFDEAMDTGTDPTITFGAGTFTSNSDDAWTVGDTVWTETFELTDNNEEIAVVTVDVTGAKDAAGNDQEAYAEVDEFDIDTLTPTVSSITRDDPNPTRAAQVYFDVDFSEPVTGVASNNFSIDATGGQVGATVDSIGGSGTSWWVLVNTVDDGEGTLSIDLNLNLTNITDAAGNEQVFFYTAGEAYDVDRLDPSVTSVSVSDLVISDADAGGTFTVTVDFDEAMNQAQDPTITFAPAIGSTLAIASDNWPDSDTYTVTYNVSDGNVDHDSVTVDVTNAEDVLGNAQSDYAPEHEFEIDTLNPIVEAVTPSVALINDAVAAGGTFTIEVEFSETIDTGTQPAISFAPSVASTLSFDHGAWSMTDFANDTYTATYNVTDAGVEIDDVFVDVTGARDAVGNLQQDYTPENEFNIDTLNPTVTSVLVNDTLITDADAGGTFTVTVDFSEPMTTDGSADPAITFAPLVGTTLAFASENWPDTDMYTATYDISDGNIDHDSVTIDVTGAKDANGNDQQDYAPVHEFEIDTLNPTITSITSTTPDGYYGLTSSINVTVSFSEPVTLTGGTLDVTLDTPGDVVGLAAFGPLTSSFTTYTVGAGDNSCDLDAINVVLNGGTLQDNVGNDAVVGLPATTIADGSDITVDTTIPVISGLDLPDTEQSVDANCTITIPYSAVVTDNCCVNASDVTVVVEFVSGAGTATLNAPAATIVNNGVDQVDISGSFTVSDLTAGDVVIRVRINGSDCTGNVATEALDIVTIGDNTIPVISGLDLPDGDQSVDEFCSITIPYSAIVVDNCCLDAGSVNVVVEFVDPFNTAVLTAPPAVIVNSGGVPNDAVTVSGAFTVSALTGDPIHVRVRINGTDCNGNAAVEVSDVVTIIDTTPPVIVWNTELPLSPQYVDSMTCVIAFPIQVTVTDNCCILAINVSVDISVTNATLVHGVTVTQMGDDVVVAGIITVSNLTGCPAVLSVAIDAHDCCGNNAVQLTDSVEIYDNTIPVTNGLTVSDETVDANCEATVTFSATVTDNCCVTPGAVTDRDK